MLAWAVSLLLAGGSVNVADVCAAEGACRTVDKLRIEAPDGKVTMVDLDMALPWVAEGNVVLTPGESVTVVLDEVDGELEPRLVRSGDASSSTEPSNGEIQFSFSEFDHGQLKLTVKNTRSDTLDYAAMMVTTRNGPSRTSVCSLMPGVMVVENWTDPIYELALWSFRRTDQPGCKTLDFPKDGTGGS